MDQRLSLVALGVVDIGRARSFYEELGVDRRVAGWGRRVLPGGRDDRGSVVTGEARSGQHRSRPRWLGGVTLAQVVASPEEVDTVVEAARSAGATIGRPGAPTDWGGYSGVFIDPDGHPWEVAHNPGWVLDKDGSVRPR